MLRSARSALTRRCCSGHWSHVVRQIKTGTAASAARLHHPTLQPLQHWQSTRPPQASMSSQAAEKESTPPPPPVDAHAIETSLNEVRAKVAEAVKRARKAPAHPPRLVAVSKTKPMEAVLAAYHAGQRVFGENYVQELVAKANDPTSPPDIAWHFIGTLQSNKAKVVAAVPNLAMIETVTSEKLAHLLDKAVDAQDRPDPLPVLVQVNTSGEDNKGGVEPAQCSDLVAVIRDTCPHLKFAGLMTIGQIGRVTTPGEVNPDFERLIQCKKDVCDKLKLDPDAVEVSMGMSGDFEHAIELGSTNVRVGSTIFGARQYKN
eukprot:m.170609 g.170609  ORF g.170609 m.170609 type:complete len:317 (-) comp13264_c0_seq1:158-1108(-)